MPSHRPRTVLILTPSSRLLGARRSLLALAESLDPQRWRPVVCSQSEGQLGDALQARDIPMHVLKLGWWRKAKYLLWRPFAISRLGDLMRRVQADLVHCNEIYPNPYAVRAVRSVMAPADSPAAGQPLPVVTHIRLGMKEGMIRKYDLGRADRIAVPSESLASEFEGHREQALVRVIYNGVNLEEYQRSRSAEAARAQLGLPINCVMFGAVGQIGPRKAGDVALDAFEKIAERVPQACLLFVGDTHRGQESFAEELKRRAQQPPLAGRVFFFPFTEKVLLHYEAIDVNLLVSRDEGFGRTIIEAGAVGVPSIGSRQGGIAEIIMDGSTGRLIPTGDADALAQAMEQLATSEALRRDLGEKAFIRTAQVFSIKAHADRMMDLYDDVLETRATSH